MRGGAARAGGDVKAQAGPLGEGLLPVLGGLHYISIIYLYIGAATWEAGNRQAPRRQACRADNGVVNRATVEAPGPAKARQGGFQGISNMRMQHSTPPGYG